MGREQIHNLQNGTTSQAIAGRGTQIDMAAVTRTRKDSTTSMTSTMTSVHFDRETPMKIYEHSNIYQLADTPFASSHSDNHDNTCCLALSLPNDINPSLITDFPTN